MKDYKDQFLESAAQPVSGPTFNEVTREGKLVRRWTTNIQQWEQAALLEQIRQRRYVDNPSCNRRGGDGDDYVPAGRWRQATAWVVIDEGGQIEPGLYEELRYGYLQPPSVSDSIPKPPSATDWSELDKEARHFIVRVFDTTVSTAMGLRNLCFILYPNVATITVKEFCEGLISRGTIINPKFGTHKAITGSFAFHGVRNEDQNDGSSNVIGVLYDISIKDSDFIVVMNGCGIKESVKYLLNSPVLPVSGDAVFPASTSGVEYSMHFEFSQELSLYNITITKREQKTLTAGVFVEGESDIDKDEAQEFSGVRSGNVDHLGNSVPLWTPGNPTPGVAYTQSLSKNQNCTTDIRQKKRTVKNLVAATVRKVRDLFHTQVSTGNKADAAALSDPAIPSGGVIQAVDNVKNGLGQFDTTLTQTTELPVTAAEKANATTVYETNTTQTDKAQDPATSLTASVSSGIIVEKSGAKTPGALLDVTTRTKVELPVTGAVKENEATIFQTRAVQTDRAQAAGTSLTASATGGVIVSKQGTITPGNLLDVRTDTVTEQAVTAATVSDQKDQFRRQQAQEDRGQAAATDISVPAATGGVVIQKVADKTPGGLLNIKTSTTTEQPVSNARISGTKTLFDVRSTVIDRSQDPATSLTVPAASLGVITTKTGDKTPGVLLDVTTETVTEQPVSSARQSETKTLYTDDTTVVDRGQAAGTSLTVPAAANGAVVTKTGEKTPGNLLDVTTQTRTEQPVSNATIQNAATVFNTTAVVVNRSQALATDLSASASAGTIVEKRGEKTNGALLDVTTTTRVELPVSSAVKANSATVFETQSRQTDKAQDLSTSLTASAGSGTIVNKTGQKTEGGKLDVTSDTITEVAVSSVVTSDEKTLYLRRQSNLDKNQASPDTSVPAATGGVVVQKRTHTTPGGRTDLTTDTTTEQAVSTARSTTSKTLFETETVVVDKNQNAPDTSVPAATGGVTVTKTADKTPGSLTDLTTQTRTEQAVTDAIKTNITTALETVVETLAKGQAAGTSLPSSVTPTTGVLVSSTGRKTPGDLLDVTTTTETAVAVDKSWSFNHIDGVKTVRIFRNKLEADVDGIASALSASNENSFSAEPTKFGRYSGGTTVDVIDNLAFADAADRTSYVVHPEVYDSKQYADQRRYFYIDTISYRCRRDKGIQAGLSAFEGGADASPSTFNQDLRHNTYYLKRVVKISRQKWTIPDAGGNPVSSGSATILFSATKQPWGNS